MIRPKSNFFSKAQRQNNDVQLITQHEPKKKIFWEMSTTNLLSNLNNFFRNFNDEITMYDDTTHTSSKNQQPKLRCTMTNYGSKRFIFRHVNDKITI